MNGLSLDAQTLLLSQRGATEGPRPTSGTPRDTRAAAEEFEAQFFGMMVGHMMSSLPTDGLFGGGHAEEVFRGFLSEEYGKLMAQNGGLGLADELERELLRLQEVEDDGSA